MAETTVTLKEEEREILFDILEMRQRALVREIQRTDNREFRASLQKREKVLESLLSRVMAHTQPL